MRLPLADNVLYYSCMCARAHPRSLFWCPRKASSYARSPLTQVQPGSRKLGAPVSITLPSLQKRTSVRVCNRSIPQDDRGLWLRATAGWSPSNLYSVSPLPGCGGCWPISMSDLTRWDQQMRRRQGQLQDKYRSCFRDLSAQVPITDITSTSDSVKFSRKSPAVPTCSSLSDVSCAYCDSEGTQPYDMEV